MKDIYYFKFVCIVLVFCCSLPVFASNSDSIKLRANDQLVEIPLVGMQKNKDAIKLAKAIKKTQKEVKKWQKEQASDSDVKFIFGELLTDLENQAITELDQGFKIITSTSSGKFPDKNKRGVIGNLNIINQIIKYKGSLKKLVETQITTTVKDGRIHYTSYRDKDENWSSYSEGQPMKIGGYFFRVSAPGITSFEELVVVIHNPHKHSLVPLETNDEL